MWFGESDLVTPEAPRRALKLAPNGRFIDVAAAGHMVAGDKNDVFIDAVAGFLD